MKTHKTKRIYRVRCKSGLMGWRTRLRNNYENFDEWEGNSDMWGLSMRLGYSNPLRAWNANPIIEGSINPSDFRKVRA